jgi:type IV pilus assembly protein PilC
MQKFNYKIIDNNNKIREGEVEAESRQKAGELFLQQGFTVLDISQKSFNFKKLKRINIGNRVALKDKVLFIRQMAFMINAGLALTQALEIAQSQIQNFYFKDVVGEVLKDVQSGIAFSKALNKYPKVFEVVIINLVKAGEESGKLDLILERVADDLEKKQEFNSKVKGALIYPVVILLAIIAVVVLLLIFMIPQMRDLYTSNNQSLPGITQTILNLSDFVSGIGGVIVLAVIIALLISLFYYRKTPSGRLVVDGTLLKLPIFGALITKSQIATFTRTLSMLISAGVPILDSLKLVANSTTNAVFKKVLDDARLKVEKGIPLSQPILGSEVVPPLVGHMMRVGEETGKVDEVIAKVGIQYAKEVDQMADNLTKLMEPLILIVMGIVVGILAIAIYLPIFNLGSAISGLK